MTMTVEIDLPADLARLRLPAAVSARLQSLLDAQDAGRALMLPMRPFADSHQLDRVMIRWDLSQAVSPDSFSYFADDYGDENRWGTSGLGVEA